MKRRQKKSDICFHTNILLKDGSTLQGGEWPSTSWYPDTPQRVCAIEDFPYPEILELNDPVKLQRSSKIPPKWGIYVEYPLPTGRRHNTMATGVSDLMSGPHTSSRLCPYCNKFHNSQDSLAKHIQFHYKLVLVCPICGRCGLNH